MTEETFTTAEVAAIVKAATAEALAEHTAAQAQQAPEQPRSPDGTFLAQLRASAGGSGWKTMPQEASDDREALVELIRAEAAAGVAARKAAGR